MSDSSRTEDVLSGRLFLIVCSSSEHSAALHWSTLNSTNIMSLCFVIFILSHTVRYISLFTVKLQLHSRNTTTLCLLPFVPLQLYLLRTTTSYWSSNFIFTTWGIFRWLEVEGRNQVQVTSLSAEPPTHKILLATKKCLIVLKKTTYLIYSLNLPSPYIVVEMLLL